MSSLPGPFDKTIALVGLSGVGKSSVGRRLAAALGMPFRDADSEVEAAAGRPIAEIFAQYGEAAFRDGERRVIARLLALNEAAAAGENGQTALAVLAICEAAPPRGPALADRIAIVAALHRAGLAADAQAFAVEGLAALRGS